MKIYTKTGDAGDTGLWGQAGEQRIPKEAPRVEAYGTVDEANAAIGMARALLGADHPLTDILAHVQHRLFALGADLATLNLNRQHHIVPDDVTYLETAIDELSEALPALRQFILPAGTPGSAALHQARTVVRRAERRLIALSRQAAGPPEHIQFLNRLSDLLFTMARSANHLAGMGDVPAEF